MAIEHVIAAKQFCVNNGINILGPCGAFNITARVSWMLRLEGWGNIHKNPGQNGCDSHGDRYAVDAIMLQNGSVIDCLINSETENIPAWQDVGKTDTSLWRAPINLDDDVPIPIPPVPTDCTCKTEFAALQIELDAVKNRLANIEDILRNHSGALTVLLSKEPPVYTGSIFGYRITLVPVK